jgi:hypothetical protein
MPFSAIRSPGSVEHPEFRFGRNGIVQDPYCYKKNDLQLTTGVRLTFGKGGFTEKEDPSEAMRGEARSNGVGSPGLSRL